MGASGMDSANALKHYLLVNARPKRGATQIIPAIKTKTIHTNKKAFPQNDGAGTQAKDSVKISIGDKSGIVRLSVTSVCDNPEQPLDSVDSKRFS